MQQITIMDTTLRDGEQAPGAAMNVYEKITVAAMLEKMGVDVIEAGFAVSSNTDFQAIRQIAQAAKDSTICSLARCVQKDIDSAGEALKKAKKSRIHLFLGTSDRHLTNKLKMTREEAKTKAVEAVRYAKNLCDEVQFSFEDASRSFHPFLCEMTRAVITAGASVINVPDTVGFALPEETKNLFDTIVNAAEGRAVISVHTHDDLGLAAANSLAAISAGATQIEATINGIGERAGNAALEEIAVIIATRLGERFCTRIKPHLITIVSDQVARICAMPKAPNKAIVGENAFSHGSGIHQDGMLKDARCYESFSAALVGRAAGKIVLTRHSGGSALKNALEAAGIAVAPDQFPAIFEAFKRCAETQKVVSREDMVILAQNLGF